jgi:hypothetical protein
LLSRAIQGPDRADFLRRHYDRRLDAIVLPRASEAEFSGKWSCGSPRRRRDPTNGGLAAPFPGHVLRASGCMPWPDDKENAVIVLGIVLLIIGVVPHIGILWSPGIAIPLIGVVLFR